MSEPGTTLRFVVADARAGERLDRVVASHASQLSRAALKRLFAQGAVSVVRADGSSSRATKGQPAEAGLHVVVHLKGAGEPATSVRAEPDPEVALRIALERADLVVVDKPAGQATAPLAPAERGTVVGGLLARYPEMAGFGYRPAEPGLCHRLDNDTSGLLLAARTAEAFQTLTTALKAGRLQKRYLLICAARGLPEAGQIDAPIAPHPRNPRRVLACTGDERGSRQRARPAVTRYRLLEQHGEHALVEARAPKALRHQIRAHFAALGFAIHGDHLYGSKVARDLGRHALHASFIGWSGDDSVQAFRVRSSLPPELRKLLD